MEKFDIVEDDFNPTIFYACKSKIVKTGRCHSHDFTEITFILSGKGKYYVDGILYDVLPGDVIICNQGVLHQSIDNSVREPMVEFVTGFADFHFTGMPENTMQLWKEKPVLRTSLETKQEISKHCYEMVAEQEGNSLGRYFMMKAQLMQLLILLLRDMQPPGEKQKACNFESYNRNYVVKKIVSYLNENYACKISLDQIAHNMYLSPVYISKLFKEETGDSPINYLIKIRLEKAKEILGRHEQVSVRSVANQVGYEDVYHFSKLFKKYYGVSPLNYSKGLNHEKS